MISLGKKEQIKKLNEFSDLVYKLHKKHSEGLIYMGFTIPNDYCIVYSINDCDTEGFEFSFPMALLERENSEELISDYIYDMRFK